MTQQEIEAIAQSILSMSAEERAQLKKTISESSAQTTEPAEASKSFRVAEIAQEIRVFEDKYNAPMGVSSLPGSMTIEAMPVGTTTVEDSPSQNGAAAEDSRYSFFRLASSLQLEGPEDWSRNVDHYLYGLPKVQDD